MPRVYVVPSFNVLVDLWSVSNPLLDPPDDVQLAQIYLSSRIPPMHMQAGHPSWLFPVLLRTSAITLRPEQGTIWRRSTGVGGYHKILFVHDIHVGFPNQYVSSPSALCTVAGVFIDPG